MAKDEQTSEDRAKEAKMARELAVLLSQNATEDELWTWAIAGLSDEITACMPTVPEVDRPQSEAFLSQYEAFLRKEHKNHPLLLAFLDHLRHKIPNT